MEGADVCQKLQPRVWPPTAQGERLCVLSLPEERGGRGSLLMQCKASDGQIQMKHPARPLVQGKRSAHLPRHALPTSNRGTQQVCEQAGSSAREGCAMRVEPCSPEMHKDVEAPYTKPV